MILDLLDKLVDIIGDQEAHPLMELLDMVSCIVSERDDQNIEIPNPGPHAMLQFFMDQHNLYPAELAEVLGCERNVEDVLNGKQEIDAREAEALAARFGVSAAVFS